MGIQTMEKAKEMLETAFLPLQCDAKIKDYGNYIVFKIYTKDKSWISKGQKLYRRSATSEDLIIQVINEFRRQIYELGLLESPPE